MLRRLNRVPHPMRRRRHVDVFNAGRSQRIMDGIHQRRRSADRSGFAAALGADEIITAVSFPVPKKAAYVKFPQPASRFALVGVFVAQTAGGVRVAVTGAASHVHRAKAIEDALAKNLTVDAAKAVKVAADRLNNDLHGSAEYRAHLVSVLAGRAVAAMS